MQAERFLLDRDVDPTLTETFIWILDFTTKQERCELQMQELFQSFFAAIPHDWFRKNNIEEYEGFYASIFYAYFCALGLDVKAEDTTNHGRIDMRVVFEHRCYIFEFKLIGTGGESGTAMQQIKAKQYAEKYRADFSEIYLIGVEFDKAKRNITAFDWEKYQ